MKCYLCLNPCSEKSPCICGIALHNQCLSQLRRKKGFRTYCTVCQEPFNPITSSDIFALMMFGLFVYAMSQGSCCN